MIEHEMVEEVNGAAGKVRWSVDCEQSFWNDMTPKQVEHAMEAAFAFMSPMMAAWGHVMVLNHEGDTQDCAECWPEDQRLSGPEGGTS